MHARTDARTNGDIEALADAMRALKNPGYQVSKVLKGLLGVIGA